MVVLPIRAQLDDAGIESAEKHRYKSKDSDECHKTFEAEHANDSQGVADGGATLGDTVEHCVEAQTHRCAFRMLEPLYKSV